jgi:hypothetical protein
MAFDQQRIHLATGTREANVRLPTRCATALGNCKYPIKSIKLREAM